MSPEIVLVLRRPLLLSCIALALSGVASAAPIRPYTGSVHVGGRRDDAAALEPHVDPASTRVHPVHVESVFNCADSGTGSLRDAVAAAADGDTIDLTQLACSTISLTTGEITIAQNTLSLVGPGLSLSIVRDNSSSFSRILTHTGTGVLTVAGLSIANGIATYEGGCIRSAGNLTLSNALVRGCDTRSTAVYDHDSRGGGVYVAGNLTMSSSTLVSNACSADFNTRAYGGGAFVHGSAYILESTISGNSVGYFVGHGNVGGIDIVGRAPSVIINSTISGNFASDKVGGLYAYEQLTLSGATIAFNKSLYGQTLPAGMQAYNALVMNSTIIANNTWYGNEFDLSAFTVTGANNLVMGSNDSPPGTLTADPDLQPLADNGGPTQTHALLATSAAVDAGNNVAGVGTDQRGAGFVRVSGAQADIGAFEFQVAAPATYTIGGDIAGLAGNGLVLQQSGGDNLPITSNGSFTFATPVNDGAQYNVTVLAQPTSPNQTCAVANGEGVVSGSNVTAVAVTCTTVDYTVGGTVSGLVGSGLLLQQNGGDDLPITADGSFTFPTPLSDGSAFTVSVSAQPSNPPETCVVVNGDGTVAGANFTDVAVTCSTDITDRIFANGFEAD